MSTIIALFHYKYRALKRWSDARSTFHAKLQGTMGAPSATSVNLESERRPRQDGLLTWWNGKIYKIGRQYSHSTKDINQIK